MLTERRKADRNKMAAMIESLCAETGATVERSERDREIRLDIRIGAARVGIEFDGGSFNTQPDVYCMPWNVDWDSDARFSAAFGHAVGASVNEAHRRKCMGFASGIDALLIRLRMAIECVTAGDAFLKPGEPIPFQGPSHEPEKLKAAGFQPIGAPDISASAAGFQRAAFEMSIPQSELTAFRHPDGYWQMYRRPRAA